MSKSLKHCVSCAAWASLNRTIAASCASAMKSCNDKPSAPGGREGATLKTPANMSASTTLSAGNLVLSGRGLAPSFSPQAWPAARLGTSATVGGPASQKVAKAMRTERCNDRGMGGSSGRCSPSKALYILKAPSARAMRSALIFRCITSGRKSSCLWRLACSASSVCCFMTACAMSNAMRGFSRAICPHCARLHVTSSPSSRATA
mmetsp:Transcript_103899/g.300515  ORF Transcript_103899/g.300515 Transcript_103899/m.300515 type:complete len:205 (+) Transcript_103899:1426-2040(+)